MQYRAAFEEKLRLSGKELGWTPSNYRKMSDNCPANTMGIDPDALEGGYVLPGLKAALESCASRMEMEERDSQSAEGSQSVAGGTSIQSTRTMQGGKRKRNRSPSIGPSSASRRSVNTALTQGTLRSV